MPLGIPPAKIDDMFVKKIDVRSSTRISVYSESQSPLLWNRFIYRDTYILTVEELPPTTYACD